MRPVVGGQDRQIGGREGGGAGEKIRVPQSQMSCQKIPLRKNKERIIQIKDVCAVDKDLPEEEVVGKEKSSEQEMTKKEDIVGVAFEDSLFKPCADS